MTNNTNYAEKQSMLRQTFKKIRNIEILAVIQTVNFDN